MAMLSGPPKEGVELSFEPIREGWSHYKTNDGVIIRVRTILLKILLAGIKEDGSAQLGLGGSVLFAVSAPPNLKGPPDNRGYTNEQIAAAITERDIPFETIKEQWNEYSVEGIKVGVKIIATIISKTSLFDQLGEPVYYVNWQNVAKASSKPEDREKFQKIWAEKHPPAPSGSPTADPPPAS
jgi:hypothetical protein